MTTAPIFTGLHLWVADMQKTTAFYQLMGLSTEDDTNGEFVRFSLPNGQALAFGTYDLTRMYDPGFVPPPRGKGPSALQFDLPSRPAVDEMYERLTGAGHHGHLRPIDAFWGARYCEVIDPDGVVVGFHSPQTR